MDNALTAGPSEWPGSTPAWRRHVFLGGVELATGTVKWFNEQKGFGFIVPDDGSKDLFVHKSNVQAGGALREGQKVEYTAAQGKKGPEATEVKGV